MDDISDFLLGNAWQPQAPLVNGHPFGWGQSEFSNLYWLGITAPLYVAIGAPTESPGAPARELAAGSLPTPPMPASLEVPDMALGTEAGRGRTGLP